MQFCIRSLRHLMLAAAFMLASALAVAGEFKAGNLVITDPWTRATPKGARVGGGFMSITNRGTKADRLIGGSLPQAGRFEVHEMAVVDDVMKMRELKNGLEIGPGETVVLKPGSYHVMFMALTEGLIEGESVDGTLRFADAGAVRITYAVKAMGAGRRHGMHKGGHMKGHMAGHGGHHGGPAPISVMGVHSMAPGKFMLGYRFMHMNMDEMKQGSGDISSDTVATTVPNHFAGMSGQPATIRVVPTEMETQMHMVSGMVGITDRITAMAMLPFVRKKMTMLTYSGATGTTRLGSSTATTSGIGDVKVGGLVKIFQDPVSSLTARLALSIPTGGIEETGSMLMPSGMTMTGRRLAYGMQLGSGTFDLIPALTYMRHHGAFSWGVQYRGVVRLESENDEDYSLGDIHELDGWAGYRWTPWLQTSVRLNGRTEGAIDGQDPNIMGPAIGADPDNYGGDRLTGFLGVNITPRTSVLKGTRFGLDVGMPLYEDVNGTRLGAGWSAMLGVTRRF